MRTDRFMGELRSIAGKSQVAITRGGCCRHVLPGLHFPSLLWGA